MPIGVRGHVFRPILTGCNIPDKPLGILQPVKLRLIFLWASALRKINRAFALTISGEPSLMEVSPYPMESLNGHVHQWAFDHQYYYLTQSWRKS